MSDRGGANPGAESERSGLNQRIWRSLASWRTAVRVARREARRSKGRSALVVAMIALPVLALSFAAVSYHMFELTPDERADRTMGAADASVQWPSDSPVVQDASGEHFMLSIAKGESAPPLGESVPRGASTDALLQRLPAGSTALSLRRGRVDLRTAEGIGGLDAVVVDANSPLTYGLLEILDGRAPRASGDVALTDEAARRLGVGLGGTIMTADGSRSYTVVGLVEFSARLDQTVLFAPIDTPALGQRLSEHWLVDTPQPLAWSDVRRLNQYGMVVASRAVFLDPPPVEDTLLGGGTGVPPQQLAVGVIVAGLGLLEVVLLAGPAFAVGARRRQRQLALVAANGGTPAHVRRIVLADGVVLGSVAAVLGVAGGIVAAFVARPFVEEHLAHVRAGGYRIYPLALAGVAGLAVLTGMLAALVPAFVAARQSVVTALAGRRGVTRSRKRWLILGLCLVALGTALVVGGALTVGASVMLAGLVVGELGMVLCTPAIVGVVARLGRALPLAPRIALRDTARNRGRGAGDLGRHGRGRGQRGDRALCRQCRRTTRSVLPGSVPSGLRVRLFVVERG